ncbi:MAG: hypothetical protein ACE5SW_03050 [Nitrososphaeraceae archaeon]
MIKQTRNNLIIISAILAVSYILIIYSSKLNIINESVAQNEGITPIDPKNVTNQTLQNFTTEDKDMSIGTTTNKNS